MTFSDCKANWYFTILLVRLHHRRLVDFFYSSCAVAIPLIFLFRIYLGQSRFAVFHGLERLRERNQKVLEALEVLLQVVIC